MLNNDNLPINIGTHTAENIRLKRFSKGFTLKFPKKEKKGGTKRETSPLVIATAVAKLSPIGIRICTSACTASRRRRELMSIRLAAGRIAG